MKGLVCECEQRLLGGNQWKERDERMERKKEELLSEWVESFNQSKRNWSMVCLCGMFFWTISEFTQGERWGNANDMGNWIVMLAGIAFISVLYAVSFSRCYTQVEGKHLKPVQQIWDVVYRMPFSFDVYYQIIARLFRKIVCCSGAGIFLLMEAGSFLDITWGEKGWNVHICVELSAASILKNVFLGMGAATFAMGMMYVGFYVCKRRNFMYFQRKKQGKIEKKHFFVSKEREEGQEQKIQERAKKRKKLEQVFFEMDGTNEENDKTTFERAAGILGKMFCIFCLFLWIKCFFDAKGDLFLMGDKNLRVFFVLLGGNMFCSACAVWRKQKALAVMAVLAGIYMVGSAIWG